MIDPAAVSHPTDSACGVRGASDWSALLARSLVGFSVESDEPTHFRGYLRNRKISEIEFIEMSTGSHVAHRRAEDIERDGRHDYLLCLQLAGVGEFHQDAREAVLQPGDLTIFDTARPTTVVSSANYRNMCMKFPQHLLPLSHAQIGQLTASRIGAAEGLAPAASTLLVTLSQIMDTISGRSRYLAARNALDVITTMFQSRLDISGRDGADISSVFLAQIQDYIEVHLSDPELGPNRIAAEQYVSVRHLHSVFQKNGLTVSSWIRARRLERCRRDLVDVSHNATPVAAVGLRWGFKTASHFGRTFKDTYGLTPAEFRRAAIYG